MKTQVFLVLLIVISIIDCRRKHKKHHKMINKIDDNEYYTYSYVPALLKNKRMKREEGEAEEADKVIVGDKVTSGEVCDLEVRDYK